MSDTPLINMDDIINTFVDSVGDRLNETASAGQAPMVYGILIERLTQGLGSAMQSNVMILENSGEECPSAEHAFKHMILPRYLPAFRRGVEMAKKEPPITPVRTH